MIRVIGEPVERRPVTEKLRKAVTENKPVTENRQAAALRKRGRPKKADAKSNADRQRAYRQRAR